MASNDDDAARKLMYYLLAQKIFNSYEQTEDGDYDGDDDDSDSSSVLENDKFEHDEDEDSSGIPRSQPRVASYFDCNMCLKLATEPLKRMASKNISQNANSVEIHKLLGIIHVGHDTIPSQ
ncbi:hypothetical protein ACFX1S_040869 [Malus domestica]